MSRFAISLLFVLSLAAWAGAQPLTFVGDSGFAPYSMLQGGKAVGIDVEVFQEAARRAGIDCAVELVPWEQVVQRIKSGKSHGGFSFFRSPAREEYALYVDQAPVHTSDYVMFTRNGHTFDFRDWQDLRGKRIGVNKGFRFSEAFDAQVAQGVIEQVEFDSESQNIAALLKGRVDAFIGQLDTTYYQLERMGMSSTIVYLPKVVMKDRPAYLVFSKNSGLKNTEQLARRFGMALRTMYRDGTYNKIARRYLFRF